MNMKLTVQQTTTNLQRAVVALTEVKDGKVDQQGAGMTIVFKTPKDNGLQVGVEYNITFTPVKK